MTSEYYNGIVVKTRSNCMGCERVKYFLRSMDVEFSEVDSPFGTVPILYIKNKMFRPPFDYERLSRLISKTKI